MTATDRISTYTITHPTDFYISDCADCGVVFGIPTTLEQRRRSDGGGFYCPNGHRLVFSMYDTDRAKKEAAERRATWLAAELDQARAEAKHQRAVANGHKGAHQRTKNRVAKGVCPCCNQSFVNLAKHMEGQHPGYSGT